MHSATAVQGLKDFRENRAIRQCKIIATMGPASLQPATLATLINNGLDIARVNFSHGDHESHAAAIALVRKIARDAGRRVTILQDLQGPKIRCGKLLGGTMALASGETYELTFGVEQTDPRVIPIDYAGLIADVKVGDLVMMDDGLLHLKVAKINSRSVTVQVLEGGTLKNRKGINFPTTLLSLPAMTEKDNRDLLFGIAHDVDVVALSFVQTARDVVKCKQIIRALGSDIPVIAKIEKLSAIEAIEEIAAVADGLMVARGDLGVECSVERVPMFQRKIIATAEKYAVPVIIATQMLESMIENPRASSAEVADVANGVLEGADCLMLSAEAATGKYPVQCVEKMDSIIRQVESWIHTRTPRYLRRNTLSHKWQEHEAIARAACEAADTLGARAIVCLSLTGSIARQIASWRPRTPIIAISPREDVIQRLGFTWGVFGMKNPLFYNTDVLLQELPELLKNLEVVKSGDTVVITAGIPMSAMRPTNMIKINRIP
jgi:pyruvate kinase